MARARPVPRAACRAGGPRGRLLRVSWPSYMIALLSQGSFRGCRTATSRSHVLQLDLLPTSFRACAIRCVLLKVLVQARRRRRAVVEAGGGRVPSALPKVPGHVVPDWIART